MKIRTRIVILLFIVTVLTFSSILILSNLILHRSFVNIENDLVAKTTTGLYGEIDEGIESIDNSAKDWARWDDTYYFITGENTHYITDNMGDSTFDNLQINGIVILDGWDIKYSKFYDYKSGTEVNMSTQAYADMAYYLENFKKQKTTGPFNIKGLIIIDGMLVEISAQDITDSDGSMTTNGSLIFAKYVYDDELRDSSGYIGATFDINATKYPVLTSYPDSEQLSPDIYKLETDSNSLESAFQLRDILGDPIGIVHLSIKHEAYRSYSDAILFYLIASFILVIIINTVLYFSVKRGILDKIEEADKSINNIISDDALSKKIYLLADEEIMSLTTNFNRLTQMLIDDRNEVGRKNQELEEANANLKKLDELKDNFLSNVSHEIRTPLTALKSYAQLMLSGSFGKISSEQRDCITIILDSINQLEFLVNDLLDVARYESGKMSVHLEDQDINFVIKSVCKEFHANIKKEGGILRTNLASTGRIIKIDTNRIKQLLRNIITNAIKYRSDRKLEIDIKTHKDGNYLTITIADNGIGIAEENMHHLFEKFYQVDPGIKRKSSGTGLGLVIAQQIAKSHHGKIVIKSEIDKGTTVQIYLRYK